MANPWRLQHSRATNSLCIGGLVASRLGIKGRNCQSAFLFLNAVQKPTMLLANSSSGFAKLHLKIRYALFVFPREGSVLAL